MKAYNRVMILKDNVLKQNIQMIKSLCAMQLSRVWFLCLEDPLEKAMASQFSILA